MLTYTFCVGEGSDYLDHMIWGITEKDLTLPHSSKYNL